MKYAASVLTAGFMMIAQASAQENSPLENIKPGQMDFLHKAEDLVIVRVIRQDSEGNILGSQTHVNSLAVFCPVIPLAKIFTQTGAAVIVYSQPGEEMLENMRQQMEKMKDIDELMDENLPFVNMAFIKPDSTIRPAYTIRQLLDMTQQLADGAISDEGAPAHDNAQLLQNIKKHVQDFCFSAM